jgi:hypothetical protein
VWENQHIVPQLDLYKMNHYDNPNRRTSLKDLEFNMNMDKIDAFELDFDADLAVDDVNRLITLSRVLPYPLVFFLYLNNHKFLYQTPLSF